MLPPAPTAIATAVEVAMPVVGTGGRNVVIFMCIFCSLYLSMVEEGLVVQARSPGNPAQMVQTAWCLVLMWDVLVEDCFDVWRIE